MNTPPLSATTWSGIDCVLLDLDGTLLDLGYDTHFWHEVVPAAWGAPRGLDAVTARAQLEPMFAACQGTLDWYCIEYWSRQLQMDIPALKRADPSRIGWLPGALEFVRALRAQGKRLVLATNSHPITLSIKDERTRLLAEFDASYSSHVFGAPKEDPRFWQALQRVEPFDPARSLFVDDSVPVLRAARRAGIEHVVAVRKPDSTRAANHHDEFPAVDGVIDLL